MAAAGAEGFGRAGPFADRNFRWLYAGGVVNMLGDQFTLVALPWLVLKLTGDPGAMGLVLAAISVPRAVFILLGGALTDRFSPKRVLMLTKHVNTVLLGLLAALVLGGRLEMWMVYPIAVAIGLATAFSVPAGTAIIPRTLPPALLGPANGLFMGTRQLTVMAGPLAAGLLVALFGDAQRGDVAGAKGLGIAFLADAVSFAVSAWTLARVAETPLPGPARPPEPVLAAIAEGLRHFWRDRALRMLCLYFAATTFFIGGPMQVAIPVLAEGRLGDGAAGLGVLMAAHGAGTLAGMVLSGMLPGLRVGTLGLTVLTVDAVAGALVALLALVTATWQGALLMVPLGLLAGFIQVVVFTWMQRRVPPAMLGRAMSLFMFIFMGVGPVSAALTGYLLRDLGLGTLFAGGGAVLTALALLGLLSPTIRGVSDAGVRPNV
ncbi:MAG TPA: MFS transporter [Azospirillaceae bacterium]|nr:MFS transporter [Azospirillaceae bacterium]